MSRQIKFRAWDKVNQQMRQVLSLEYWDPEPGGEFVLGGCYLVPDCRRYRNIEELELLQYTGIKDRIGREIYEGDVVRSDDDSIGIIKYDKGCFYYDDWIDGWTSLEDIYAERFAKIIGNLYEHPHLINRSNNNN